MIAIGFALVLGVIAVCSWRVDQSPESRGAQQEANSIAVIERMDINLGDCYRWLIQFDDSKQVYSGHGYDDATAQRMAIDDIRRDHTFAEYRAILQRCGVLWGQATENEKLRAMQ